MNANTIFRAIGDQQDEWILDAEPKPLAAKRGTWVRWAALAACLCLVCIGFAAFGRTSQPAIQPPAESTAAVTESSQTEETHSTTVTTVVTAALTETQTIAETTQTEAAFVPETTAAATVQTTAAQTVPVHTETHTERTNAVTVPMSQKIEPSAPYARILEMPKPESANETIEENAHRPAGYSDCIGTALALELSLHPQQAEMRFHTVFYPTKQINEDETAHLLANLVYQKMHTAYGTAVYYALLNAAEIQMLADAGFFCGYVGSGNPAEIPSDWQQSAEGIAAYCEANGDGYLGGDASFAAAHPEWICYQE